MRAARLICLCTFSLFLAACGGSVSTTSSAGGDSGTTGDASVVQTTDCAQPPPALDCQGCNGTVSPDCENGAWVCPPLPPCPFVPDASALAEGGADAGAYGSSDAGSSDAGAGNDAGLACACDYATQYCEVSYGPPQPDGGGSVTYVCRPFSACDGGCSCACVTLDPFCYCAEDAGDVTETCPFHV